MVSKIKQSNLLDFIEIPNIVSHTWWAHWIHHWRALWYSARWHKAHVTVVMEWIVTPRVAWKSRVAVKVTF